MAEIETNEIISPKNYEHFDSVSNILGLSPSRSLYYFADIWYAIFIWEVFSSLFLTSLIAGWSAWALRKHYIARYYALLIVISSFLSSITFGTLTSAVIAGVYRSCGFQLVPYFAMIWGVLQTMTKIFAGYLRIIPSM